MTAADRWLLKTVCRTFRAVVTETVDPGRRRILDDVLGRRRILDDVLDRAISSGGLATVKVLIDKPSCMWNTVDRAASRGDLEMVRFIVEHRVSDRDLMWWVRFISAALVGRHMDVAEYLWICSRKKIRCRYDFEELLFASAKSGAISTLEWTFSKNRKVASMVLRELPERIMMQALFVGDMESIEYILDAMTPDAVKRQLDGMTFEYGYKKAVLRHLHERFGFKSLPKDVAMSADNHDAVEFMLEISYDILYPVKYDLGLLTRLESLEFCLAGPRKRYVTNS